jgi:hypothetical protein
MSAHFLTLGVSLVCFASSLTMPAFYATNGPADGMYFLMFGWLGPLSGQFGWFANPLLLIAHLLSLRGWFGKAAACGLFATLLALTSLSMTALYGGSDGSYPIVRSGSGVYLWILSHASACAGYAFTLVRSRRAPA